MRPFMRLSSLSALVVVFLVASCAAQSRPPILGVSHIAVYTGNPAQAEHFYVQQIGLKKASDPENPRGVRYYVNQEQFVEVLPLPANAGTDRLDHIGYMTANAEQLRKYLAGKGVAVPDQVEHASDGSLWFDVKDPEANTVQFLQPPARLLRDKDTASLYALPGADPIGRRMIHVGMLVHSAEKENTFYRAILGFQPYWHGGMHADKTDWISQQVPNGHDWIEYMLTSGPSGSGAPQSISRKELGVLDHFSLGVINMEKSVTTLDSEDRLGGEAPRPQIGRDGKWQFNMYDPDDTRVEMMEFTAASKPCCSGFTASNPSPAGQP
ncbi:MAG TPA: VOC family protein [Acidobacteriaceae bacterium]|jgi:catechol 2,3-dioxygenase-like lactoylglutathione lyase family enzyme|nr:VOC family protein [Acidobacteriaceae bacterium]